MLKEDDKRRPPEIKGNVHGRWKDTPKQDKTMLNGYICYMLGKGVSGGLFTSRSDTITETGLTCHVIHLWYTKSPRLLHAGLGPIFCYCRITKGPQMERIS